MAETLTQIITAVASRGGYHLRGIATSGTQTTLTSTKLIQREGYWTGKYIYFISGSNMGLERVISDYTAGILTFASLPYTVAASDEFEIEEFLRDDLLMVVQEAIGAAGGDWMRIVVDESLELNSGVQVYDLPDDLVSILSIDYYSTTGAADVSGGTWVALRGYDIFGAPGSRKLQLRGFPNIDTEGVGENYAMRIHYLALPVMLSEDADTLNLGEIERSAIAYIKEMALHYMNEQRFERNRTGEDARACLTAAQQHMAKAQELKQRANPHIGTRRYSTRVLPRHI